MTYSQFLILWEQNKYDGLWVNFQYEGEWVSGRVEYLTLLDNSWAVHIDFYDVIVPITKIHERKSK